MSSVVDPALLATATETSGIDRPVLVVDFGAQYAQLIALRHFKRARLKRQALAAAGPTI